MFLHRYSALWFHLVSFFEKSSIRSAGCFSISPKKVLSAMNTSFSARIQAMIR